MNTAHLVTNPEAFSACTVQATPTMGLRFVNDILHQAYSVVTIREGIPTDHRIEWRPVESVKSAEAEG